MNAPRRNQRTAIKQPKRLFNQGPQQLTLRQEIKRNEAKASEETIRLLGDLRQKMLR